jgi:hypothetical protein
LYLAAGTFGTGVFFSTGGLAGAGNGAIMLATAPELCEAFESADACRPPLWPDAYPILNVRTPMLSGLWSVLSRECGEHKQKRVCVDASPKTNYGLGNCRSMRAEQLSLKECNNPLNTRKRCSGCRKGVL